jgi:hypothetical protein
MASENPTLRARFWAKVNKTETCWLWTAGKHSAGYGVINLCVGVNQVAYAHRLSYEWAKGPIPDGLEIDHLCRVRNCVNPDHLEAVTGAVNNLRGESAAARHSRKTHCPRGHAYSGQNLYRPKRGGRQCRACRPIVCPPKGKQPPKTHCVNGHEFSGDNLIVTKRQRVCRTCRYANMARFLARRAQKQVAETPPNS